MPALPHDHVPETQTESSHTSGSRNPLNTDSIPVVFSSLQVRHLQLVSAVGRFVHPMSLLQQLEELLHWDSRVWRTSQGEDLPQQNPVRPSEPKTTNKCSVQMR